MQLKLLVIIFITSVVVNGLVPESKDVGLIDCENIYSVIPYPRVITNITVLRTSPLRVRIHLLAKSPSKSIPYSVEGMVCHVGFDQKSANAACRSQDFNKAVYVTNVEWQPPTVSGQECIMDTGNYKAVIPCEYILHQINCPLWAINLAQCTFPPLFTQPSACNRYTHVGLICT